jgi:HEAT repeat protein
MGWQALLMNGLRDNEIESLLLEQDAEFQSEFSSASPFLTSAVGSAPEPELLAAGAREIHSADPRRRILGIRLIRELKQYGAEAGRELSGLLAEEQDPDVLYWIVGAFGFLKSGLVTDQLINLVSYPDPAVRYNVATALSNSASDNIPAKAVDALIALSEDEDPEVRYSAVFELGSWWRVNHDPRIESALRRVIATDDHVTVARTAEERLLDENS